MITWALLLAMATQISRGTVVVEPRTLSITPVDGLANTHSSSQIISSGVGDHLPLALRVQIREESPEANATQLGLQSSAPVKAGDTILATFFVRGTRTKGAAHIRFLFAQTTDPWTKSVIRDFDVTPEWREIRVPFTAIIDYPAGHGMALFYLAFGPQTIELSGPNGGPEVDDLGNSVGFEALVEQLQLPQPPVRISFDKKHPQQTMVGFGGDFPQAQYGGTEALDAVGEYVMSHLHVAHARVGLPLKYWAPSPGQYQVEGPAQASMETLAEMSKRHIPTVLSIWEGPPWMFGGKPQQAGLELPKDQYDACIEAIGQYLVAAKSKFGVTVDNLSFNEPDSGVKFKFTSDSMRDFIRRAGPRFDALGLKTKFVVGDTGGGTSLVDFATPILEDPTITYYLGPITFHSWDALQATDAQYSAIRQLGARFKKPVLCLEVGQDPGLWRAQGNPFSTWDNALRTAMAYTKTLQFTGASVMDYWTYEDNFPLVDHANNTPYPVFGVIQQMQELFAPGRQVVLATSSSADIQALGSIGKNGDLDVLLVNNGGVGQATLASFSPRAKVRVITRTAQGLASSAVVASNSGELKIRLPSRSVVTVLPMSR
jgi:O-glycosyl hydrolase